MKNYLIAATIVLLFAFSCKQATPPEPVGALPSEAQLKWHEMNFYAFVHFNMNTFTGNEWGFGDASPETFNPTELDCRQWARVCKEAGMKGIIITAKHHDGFCLWPSAYSEYSVKNSKWKDGKGDVVRELSDACKEYGLKFGVYLSPWDRNHAKYGTPEYVEYFRNQLRELLTNYGDIFEVWFDGANGGTGYYGGASENRKVDKTTYYDWPNTYKIVYELQSQAIIFSDGGPGCRWVGNEHGTAYETNWNTLNRAEFAPGVANINDLHYGQEDGTHWVPAEVDVSIRPGWYYHPYQDHQVKTLPHLLDIYYNSVGRGANLLLNFPVDNRGLIHEQDAQQVLKMAEQLKLDFANDLVVGKAITASSVRGNKFKAKNLTDGNQETYWSTPDSVRNASFEIDFGQETAFNRLLIQENIALGQRIRKFSVEIMRDGEWQNIANETTIGYKRILRLPTMQTSKIRVTIVDSKACPVISNFEIFNAPKVLTEPQIKRDKQGLVTIESADVEASIYYTIDGTEPSIQSLRYENAFIFGGKGTVKAIVADLSSDKTSPVHVANFDVSAVKWNVFKPAETDKTKLIFDGDDRTAWIFDTNKIPAELIVDLGESLKLNGFSYTPDQNRHEGIVFNYQFFVSTDGKTWKKPVAEGEFSNIENSPVKQDKLFAAQIGRFVKLKAISTVGDQKVFGIAEFSVFSE